jgi:hypothetical protein
MLSMSATCGMAAYVPRPACVTSRPKLQYVAVAQLLRLPRCGSGCAVVNACTQLCRHGAAK